MSRTTTRRSVIRASAAGALAALPLGSDPIGAAGRTILPHSVARQDSPVEIEYWHINTETLGGPAVKELIDRFHDANPAVRVTERFQPDGYTGLIENIQTALVADNPPDVAQIGYGYLEFVAANLPHVTAEALADQSGDPSLLAAFPDNMLALGRSRGEQIGLPYSLSFLISFINADLFQEAGLDPENPPRTWDAWAEAGQIIADTTGVPGFCIAGAANETWATQAMVESNGGQFLDCDGVAAASFDRPEAVAAIDFWADQVQGGAALNVLGFAEALQAFLSGGVAAFVGSTSNQAAIESQAGFAVRAAPFPSFGERDVRLPAGGNALVVFSEGEPKRQAAWQFVTFLESPESLTTWDLDTGYLPPRAGLVDDPAFLGEAIASNPIRSVAATQLPLVAPWASFPGPNALQCVKVLYDAVQSALTGQQGAEDALASAADEVNGLIDGQTCS